MWGLSEPYLLALAIRPSLKKSLLLLDQLTQNGTYPKYFMADSEKYFFLILILNIFS